MLSRRQQILVAPTSHLEDIRKNITEDLQTETEPPEDDQSEEPVLTYQPVIEDDANEVRTYALEANGDINDDGT